jgi:hypothetical protein
VYAIPQRVNYTLMFNPQTNECREIARAEITALGIAKAKWTKPVMQKGRIMAFPNSIDIDTFLIIDPNTTDPLQPNISLTPWPVQSYNQQNDTVGPVEVVNNLIWALPRAGQQVFTFDLDYRPPTPRPTRSPTPPTPAPTQFPTLTPTIGLHVRPRLTCC